MALKITIEAIVADQADLGTVMKALTGIGTALPGNIARPGGVLVSTAPAAAAPATPAAPAALAPAALVPVATAPAPAAKPAPKGRGKKAAAPEVGEGDVTIDEVRQAMANLAKAPNGGYEEAKRLLTVKYSAKDIPSLDAAHYGNIIEDANNWLTKTPEAAAEEDIFG